MSALASPSWSLLAGLFLTQLLFTGHAAVRWWLAGRLGLQVARVRLGWGPAFWTFDTRGGARVELRLLPPLAMVAIRGHDPLPGVASYRATYGRSDLGRRVLLTLAGPAYYVLLTLLPLFAIVLFAGMPDAVTPSPMQVGEVMPGSPAEQGGIESGDTILRANGVTVLTAAELSDVAASRADVPTEIELQRGGRRLALTVTPRRLGSERPRIGVAARRIETVRRVGALEAAAYASSYAWRTFAAHGTALVELFSPRRTEGLAGPEGMTSLVGAGEHSHVFLAILLLNVYMVRFWVMCLLPLPFCAGGRLLLLIPEALGRAQPSARVERAITWAFGSAYVLLFAVVTIADVTS